MNYHFLPFKRLIVFVLSVVGLVIVGREASHTLGETHPYAVDLKRAKSARAASDHHWLALRGGRPLIRQRVERDVKSRSSRFYQIFVPLVPAASNRGGGGSGASSDLVKVIVLFDGKTRDEAVTKARDVLIRAGGGGEIVGTRADFADPREYFPNLSLADDAFVLASGRTPWSWMNIAGASAVCLAGIVFGGWPMLTAVWESRRDAEEWEAATAPPQRRLPDITVS